MAHVNLMGEAVSIFEASRVGHNREIRVALSDLVDISLLV